MTIREVIDKRRIWVLALALGCLMLLPMTRPASAQSTYTVQSGDTLTAIAASFGVSIGAIVDLNGLPNPDLIIVGQSLQIPGGAPAPDPEPVQVVAPAPEPEPVGVGGGVGTYTVEAGGTLSGIASAFGVTVSALVEANGIANPNLIVTGQVLVLPGSSGPPASTPVVDVPVSVDRETVRAMIYDAAAIHREDPYLMMALAWRESGWQQDVVSSAGAVGVMQLMPGTAAWAGPALVGREIDPVNSAWDNIETGVAFYAHLYAETGDDYYALASYYQGLYSVQTQGLYGETEDYVENVLAMRDLFATGRMP